MTSPHASTLSFHRERLLDVRTQLLQRIAHERGGLVSRADMAAKHDVRSFDDRAHAISERNEEFAMNEHETAQLGDIEAALERVKAGTYGLCIDCGAIIPPARLIAYPTAKRCVGCQTQKEQRR
jgi:DnaK suppressor protein